MLSEARVGAGSSHAGLRTGKLQPQSGSKKVARRETSGRYHAKMRRIEDAPEITTGIARQISRCSTLVISNILPGRNTGDDESLDSQYISEHRPGSTDLRKTHRSPSARQTLACRLAMNPFGRVGFQITQEVVETMGRLNSNEQVNMIFSPTNG